MDVIPILAVCLLALGCFDNDLDVPKLKLIVNDVTVFEDSVKTNFDEPARASIGMKSRFSSEACSGGEATAYGCDLTHGYVDENAAYYFRSLLILATVLSLRVQQLKKKSMSLKSFGRAPTAFYGAPHLVVKKVNGVEVNMPLLSNGRVTSSLLKVTVKSRSTLIIF